RGQGHRERDENPLLRAALADVPDELQERWAVHPRHGIARGRRPIELAAQESEHGRDGDGARDRERRPPEEKDAPAQRATKRTTTLSGTAAAYRRSFTVERQGKGPGSPDFALGCARRNSSRICRSFCRAWSSSTSTRTPPASRKVPGRGTISSASMESTRSS